jgi:hypothetical protein
MSLNARSMFYVLLMLLIGTIIGLVFSALRSTAQAHLEDRPDLNKWAKGLHVGGIPCCDGSDTIPITDPDWRVSSEGHYEIRLEQKWFYVPDSTVIKEPNKYGQTLVWGWWNHDVNGVRTFYVRCFLPAAGT